jgi:hypothetical protein
MCLELALETSVNNKICSSVLLVPELGLELGVEPHTS